MKPNCEALLGRASPRDPWDSDIPTSWRSPSPPLHAAAGIRNIVVQCKGGARMDLWVHSGHPPTQNNRVPAHQAALKCFARLESKEASRLRVSPCFCSLEGGVWVSLFSCPLFLSSLTFMNFRCLSLWASEGRLGEARSGPCPVHCLLVKPCKGHPTWMWLQPICWTVPSLLAHPRDARVLWVLP